MFRFNFGVQYQPKRLILKHFSPLYFLDSLNHSLTQIRLIIYFTHFLLGNNRQMVRPKLNGHLIELKVIAKTIESFKSLNDIFLIYMFFDYWFLLFFVNIYKNSFKTNFLCNFSYTLRNTIFLLSKLCKLNANNF